MIFICVKVKKLQLSNVNNIMSYFLYQLPSHLWDELMVKNTFFASKANKFERALAK